MIYIILKKWVSHSIGYSHVAKLNFNGGGGGNILKCNTFFYKSNLTLKF